MGTRNPVLTQAGLVVASAAILSAPEAVSQAACDKPVLRAEGRMSGLQYAPAHKERDARRLSIAKWQQLVTELHGASYANWARSRGRKIDCDHYRDKPELDGRVSCVAAAIPCRTR